MTDHKTGTHAEWLAARLERTNVRRRTGEKGRA